TNMLNFHSSNVNANSVVDRVDDGLAVDDVGTNDVRTDRVTCPIVTVGLDRVRLGLGESVPCVLESSAERQLHCYLLSNSQSGGISPAWWSYRVRLDGAWLRWAQDENRLHQT